MSGGEFLKAKWRQKRYSTGQEAADGGRDEERRKVQVTDSKWSPRQHLDNARG